MPLEDWICSYYRDQKKNTAEKKEEAELIDITILSSNEEEDESFHQATQARQNLVRCVNYESDEENCSPTKEKTDQEKVPSRLFDNGAVYANPIYMMEY